MSLTAVAEKDGLFQVTITAVQEPASLAIVYILYVYTDNRTSIQAPFLAGAIQACCLQTMTEKRQNSDPSLSQCSAKEEESSSDSASAGSWAGISWAGSTWFAPSITI